MKRQNPNLPVKKAKDKTKIAVITAIACVCVVAVIIGAIAIFNVVEYNKNTKAVGKCGQYDIPFDELRFVTLYYRSELEARYGEGIWDDPATAEKYRAELEENVLDNLSQAYAVLTICESYNIDPDGDDVKEYVNTFINDLTNGDKSEYKAHLKEINMTERLFEFTVKIAYLQEVIHYMLVDGGVYVQYRTKNIDEFIEAYTTDEDNFARTFHIYIQNDLGEDKDANLRLIQEAADELNAISDANERVELMKKLIGRTSDPHEFLIEGEKHFSKHELNDAYEKTAFELDINEVSKPFEYLDGYCVVMRVQPDDEYVIKNSATLLSEYQRAQSGLFIETYRNNYPATFNEYGKSLDLVTLE